MSMPPVLKPIFNESPAPTPTKTPPIIAFIKGFVVTVTIGTNIVTTEMPITLMKLRIVDCFPNFTNPRMKTGMFKNKMKIPVLIWIPILRERKVEIYETAERAGRDPHQQRCFYRHHRKRRHQLLRREGDGCPL